jgi:hypothetical protein
MEEEIYEYFKIDDLSLRMMTWVPRTGTNIFSLE